MRRRLIPLVVAVLLPLVSLAGGPEEAGAQAFDPASLTTTWCPSSGGGGGINLTANSSVKPKTSMYMRIPASGSVVFTLSLTPNAAMTASNWVSVELTYTDVRTGENVGTGFNVVYGEDPPDVPAPSVNTDTLSGGAAGRTVRVKIQTNAYAVPPLLNMPPTIAEAQINVSATTSFSCSESPIGFPTGSDPENLVSGDPVDVASGNLVDTKADFDTVGGDELLRWSRTYNSLTNLTGVHGKGWWSAVDQYLSVSGDIVWYDETGRWVRLLPIGGAFKSLDGAFSAAQVGGKWQITRRDGTIWYFDSSNKIEKWSDWRGRMVTVTRNTSGRVTSLASSSGRSIAFTYNSAGRVLTATASDGRVVSYSYNTGNFLVSVSLPGALVWNYQVSSTGLITKVTDPAGVDVLVQTFDSSRRVVTQTPNIGYPTSYVYDATLKRTTVTYGSTGKTAVFGWDDAGRVTSFTNIWGKVQTRSYSAAGFLVGVVDETGRTSSRAASPVGEVSAITAQNGRSFGASFDAANRATTLTDSAAGALSRTYQGSERVASTETGFGQSLTRNVAGTGEVLSIADGDGVTNTFTWDAGKVLLLSATNSGGTTTFSYNSAGSR